LTIESDIVILGAGPAGCSAARKLGQLGYSVLLVSNPWQESADRVESLSPGARILLEKLGYEGLREIISDAAQTLGWKFWGGDRSPSGESGSHSLVRRGEFIRCMQKETLGPRVVLRADLCLRSFTRMEDHWDIHVSGGARKDTIRSRFLVDACGRQSPLPGKKQRCLPGTLALCGRWHTGPKQRNVSFIESQKDYWLWGGSMGGGWFSLVLFLDGSSLPGGGRKGMMDEYLSRVRQSEGVKKIWQKAVFLGLSACDSTVYFDTAPQGPGYIKTGDANFALDPVSSQGIQSAIKGSLQAAIVIHTLLSRPADAKLASGFYQERQKESVNRHLSLRSAAYRQAFDYHGGDFWARRLDPFQGIQGNIPGETLAILRGPVHISSLARLEPHPCLCGDLVVSKTSLKHPELERPVAYWAGVEIGTLLNNMGPAEEISGLISRWSEKMDAPQAEQLLAWLWSSRVLLEGPSKTGV
jgi:flavin-dependent dehydrogenase